MVSKEAVLVGVDPGFSHVGVAAMKLDGRGGMDVVAMELLASEKSKAKANVFASEDNVQRAQWLCEQFEGFLDRYYAIALAAESMSFVRNAAAASKMAMFWGVMAAVAFKRGIPIVQCSPQKLKKQLTSNASASKLEVQNALVGRFPVSPVIEKVLKGPKGPREHLFDALGAAVALRRAPPVEAALRALSVLVE